MQDTGSVRIGPITLFTLIAVICLSTLAVLSVTTATASFNLAQLQAVSTQQQYEAESAAQYFVACVDQQRTGNATAGASGGSLAASLDSAVADVEARYGQNVTVSAQLNGSTVAAVFSYGDGRELEIEIELKDGGAYSITKWNMTAKVNSAESLQLWTGM